MGSVKAAAAVASCLGDAVGVKVVADGGKTAAVWRGDGVGNEEEVEVSKLLLLWLLSEQLLSEL